MMLSQELLNLLTTCPRKFQHIYLERLTVPVSPEAQEQLNWGIWFHLLMQRRELELETEPVLGETSSELEQQLQQCVDRFVATVPDLFRPQPTQSRQSEHRRTFYLANHLLTVVYDLLILEPQQAQILDWKTTSQPQLADQLLAEQFLEDWQTRLYCFVLAETSPYAPEQISMTYWFVPSDHTLPQSVRLNYSQALHQQTQQELSKLLHQLDAWLEGYAAGMAFPQVNAVIGHCETCTFANRCHRESTNSTSVLLPNWEDLQEVAL